MAIGMFTTGQYKNFTASGNVSKYPCAVLGVICATTSSGTVTLYDDAATGTGTAITGTITPAAGSYTPINAETTKGLNIVVGGTINATVIYSPSAGV